MSIAESLIESLPLVFVQGYVLLSQQFSLSLTVSFVFSCTSLSFAMASYLSSAVRVVRTRTRHSNRSFLIALMGKRGGEEESSPQCYTPVPARVARMRTLPLRRPMSLSPRWLMARIAVHS